MFLEKANEEEAQRFAHDAASKAAEVYAPHLPALPHEAIAGSYEEAILIGIRWAAHKQDGEEDVSHLGELRTLLEDPNEPFNDSHAD